MNEILKTIDKNPSVFQYYNANPHGNNTNDCVIRAICGVTDREWDDVLMDLTLCAIKHKLMIDDPDLYTKYLKENGWKKCKQPKKSNGKKYKAYEWAPTFKGKAIAHVGSHHMVMISHGKVWDTWYSLDGVVGNYWIKE
jgi:hypothetical protein